MAVHNAVAATCEAINSFNIPCAVIGGTACVILGSDRSTSDIDVARQCPADRVNSLKEDIAERFPSFTCLNGVFKRVLRHSAAPDHPIEFLSSGNFLIPHDLTSASSVVDTSGGRVPVMFRAQMLFSKAKRAAEMMESSRPRSLRKLGTDVEDIGFLSDGLKHEEIGQVLELLPAGKGETITSATRKVASIKDSTLMSVKLAEELEAIARTIDDVIARDTRS